MQIDQLLNKSADSIIACDARGNITEFNKAAENTLGYSREEVLGKNISLISGDSGLQILKQLFTTGTYVGEVINRRKDGSKYVAFLSANLLYDNEGIVIGSMGVSRDISNLKLKEQQYTSIVENASHVIYTVDLEGKFNFVNSSVTKFFGYSVEEIIGKSYLSIIVEEDHQLVSNFYKEQFHQQVNDTTLEFRIRTKSGLIKWVSQDVNALFSSTDANKIIGFQGLVRIIDDIKRSKQKLQETEIKYRELFNNSTDLIHSIDLEGNFKYVNETWKKKLRYSDEELSKINLFDLIHPDSKMHCFELIKEIKSKKVDENILISYKVLTKDQEVLVLEGGLSFGKEKGEVVSIQSFLRDVTAQRRAQEIIEEQNKEIKSSIAYAKDIQESVLPKKQEIKEVFSDSFVFYKPRDVVSGDFYIVDTIRNNDGQEMPCFIIGDCTGHGVPGAVLSLMCNVLIRESFTKKEINSPAEALNFVRNKLINFFQSGSKKLMRDGMDVAFCVVNKAQGELYFAGANLPCIIISDGELKQLRGNRQHVGYNHRRLPFSHQSTPIKKGDLLFIYSDGYHDQFGGDRNKKLSRKKLHELLLKNQDLPMKELGRIIEDYFYQWKGEYEQIDDVTIIGIRL
jgi:PAS domain S-box-containing protein